ncbi:hypothetical protein [Sphingobium fuliginis]|uniref:Uncharacterized protein n=1 Tax=Sphingobium fuliginis ATCC 27551 TaxID=1208342 RepID=A0A5B8CCX8_SPHSA|nr:hypothetical protein [Sphingobium fuliginis]QDC36472.1 hypothetical protein FIL70_03645 [Sphingobium fuliginis ATCC 27551]
MTYARWPRTLDELRQMSRSYGEAAVAEARWGAVSVWFMDGPKPDELSNSREQAWDAADMVRQHQRYHLRWPRAGGKQWPAPALDGLDPVSRQAAERIAAETLADWERAGCPRLSAHSIKQVFQCLLTFPPFRAAA